MGYRASASPASAVFKTIRITILLFILFFVAVSTWLTTARSTDWNNSLWVKIYPINADGSEESARYIDSLEVGDFTAIEEFIAREAQRYGKSLQRPVRIEFGREIREQPPTISAQPGMFDVMLWSIKMRWWASSRAGEQDAVAPDVRIFVRYHRPRENVLLENSVGLQKGMVGIVNARASSRHTSINNVVVAHEFLHTLGATDKYVPATGQPLVPDGLAEPDRAPLYPQRFAEIMGGRIARAADEAIIPKGLKYARIGPLTAAEIRLSD